MKPHLSLWAKLGSYEYPESYHPLLFHMIDVSGVALALWDTVLLPPMRRHLAQVWELKESECRSWVAFLVGAHDIGKATPDFQSQGRSSSLLQYLYAKGYPHYAKEKLPHASLTVPILQRYLSSCLMIPKRFAKELALVVGGHHGFFPNVNSGFGQWAFWDRNPWGESQEDLLAALAELLALSSLPTCPPNPTEQAATLMILAGMTAVADWIGSHKLDFPPVGNPQNWMDEGTCAEIRTRNYFVEAQTRGNEVVKRLRWRLPSLSRQAVSFRSLFAYAELKSVRPLQKCAETVAAQLDGPGLVLIEAPMGEGKTEGALYLADAWLRQQCQGMYFALPTMATCNGLFPRVMHFLEANYQDWKQLHLLHGKNLLSPAYQELRNRAAEQPLPMDLYDEDAAPSGVIADSWFAQDRRQGLLAPFAVGTIDQALLSILNVRHGFVRLFGLAGKTVILDEVHAYDTYMTELLERLLEWLGALRCGVVLLSATLPRNRREKLLQAYAGKTLTIPQGKYPRITHTTVENTTAHVETFEATFARRVEIRWHEDDLENLGNWLKEQLRDGGCAVVIRNTVGLAQKTYSELKKYFKEEKIEIELFHARFLFKHRQDIENRILKKYGKGVENRPNKAILIATQVVEQSLDLDFDLLITDLSPVDLFLQRIGRLHRHMRTRPSLLDKATAVLLRPQKVSDGIPEFGVSQKIYNRYILLKSYRELAEKQYLDIPNNVEEVIESVYGDERQEEDPLWNRALIQAKNEKENKDCISELNAQSCQIVGPRDDDGFLFNPKPELDEESPDGPQDFRASTREGEPTVTVVVAYKRNGQYVLDPNGGSIVDLSATPTLEMAKELLGNSVNIPKYPVFRVLALLVSPQGWAKNGLLRNCYLLPVDTTGQGRVGKYTVSVDPLVGVETWDTAVGKVVL